MKEENLRVFLNSIIHFFGHTSDPNVVVGSPYLVDNVSDAYADYTGLISISGQYHGVCYFSAPRILLRHLILSVGETDTSELMMRDAVGEVANTLSGNARKEFGQGFNISAPHVTKGLPSIGKSLDNERIYAIPIAWKSYKAMLGISLH